MHAGYDSRSGRQVGCLIIEEEVRPQDFKDIGLLNAAEKEGVVDRDAPVLQAPDGSLVGRRISCRDEGDMQSNPVARIIPFEVFLPSLDAIDPCQEVAK